MLQINKEFLLKNKCLKHNHVIILLYLYQWLASNKAPTLKRFEDGRLYFYIYINKIAEDLLLTKRQVQNALYRLENKDKAVQTELEPFIYAKNIKTENRLYISINPHNIQYILAEIPDNLELLTTLTKKLNGNTYKVTKIEGKDDMLLDEADMNMERKWSIESEMVVKRLLKKYPSIFTTKVPQGKYTKTFSKACTYIQDIYNGTFTNPHIYPLCDNFKNNKQFSIEGYKETLNSVKGDWVKVKKLLFNAVENYKLMQEKERMPFNKDYLTSSLTQWLYNDWSNGERDGSSYVIYSLKEPNYTKKQLSQNKADRIFNELDEEARIYGNKIIELNLSMPSGQYWQNIQDMVAWGNTLLKYETNAGYWITSPSNILEKYYEYIMSNNLTVSLNTVNIKQSVASGNVPWIWFLQEAIKRHDFNDKVYKCVTPEDFENTYSQHYDKSMYYDEMDDFTF